MRAFASSRHRRPAGTGLKARVESEAFYFQPVDRLHFFALSSSHFDKECDEIDRFMDVFSINSERQLIYHHNTESVRGQNNALPFEQRLLTMLKKHNASDCYDAILNNTESQVLTYGIGLQTILARHGLENIYGNMLKLLNPIAVNTLKCLCLPVIPRLYNWICETGDHQKLEYRCHALLRYPLLFIPLVKPSLNHILDTVDLEVASIDNNDGDELLILSRLIDSGQAIEPALIALFNIDEIALAKLKYQLPWQIDFQTSLPNYEGVEQNLEFYRMLLERA